MSNINNINDNFLKLLFHPLDNAQEAALKTEKNAVIAAGAGSGKTQVLATRFAWLIMTGQAKVDEILTLTFTNKAASEMYQRIYQSLSFFANKGQSPDLTSENINLAKEALNSFSNAHIQTLDSYCGGIVKQCANRYGIRPDFTTGSSDSGRDIKNKAFEFVIENKENLAVKTFADPGKLQDFAENTLGSAIENYTSLGTEKDFFVKKLYLQRREIADAWNYYALGYTDIDFSNAEHKSLKQHISEIRNILMTSDKINKPEKAKYVQIIENLILDSSSLFNLEKITEEDIINNSEHLNNSISFVEEYFKKIENAAAAKQAIQDVKSAISKMKKEKVFIDSISAYLKQYTAIFELNKLFDSFLEKINSSKRTSGNLSFNDITSMALKILLENEDIRNQEKNSFKKIMIDEFQDNNGNNRDLLYILAIKEGEFEDNGNCIIKTDENNSLLSQIVIRDNSGKIIEDKRSPNKLFFVGDEKQSIYKFRGAEVSVFNELTKDGENDLIPMYYNYRSTPELLQSFNSIFKGGNGIFETTENRKDYEAYYEKYASKNGMEQLPSLTKDNVPVHVAILCKDTFALNSEEYDYIPEKDQLAYFMAKKIYEIGKEIKNWKSIAILERGRSDRNIITKYLSMFNVPYEVDQFNNIFEDGIVNDFYNFFRLCVYPSDINSYAVYLSSPFCGLSINAVEIVLSHINSYAKINGTSFTPFPDDENTELKIKKDLELTGQNNFEKYLTGKEYFKKNKNIILQQRITSTLSDLWHKKGYKYESLLTKKTELCAEHFDMLFELGRQADSQGKSVSWFVDQLELLKSSFSSETADIDAKGVTYPLERQEAVQIMTIHKSKGLQFDHVFVYGCISPKPKSNTSNIYFDEKLGLTIKPDHGGKNYFSEKGSELFKAKELAEFRRLIYVAITRAINDVYIIGVWNPRPKTATKGQYHLIENTINKFYPELTKTYLFNKDAGFDYIEIEPIEYSQIPNINTKTPLEKIRKDITDKTENIYNSAKLIKYECHPIERKTPSSLEPDFIKAEAEDSDSGEKYEEASDLLTSADFSAADFGTLVHAYLEAQANNIAPENFEPPVSMFKNLTESKIQENKKICIQMCSKFKSSKNGQELEKVKLTGDFYRAEWGFRMMMEGTIFTGSIDLIYSNGDGSYTIVDYKSDNNIEPEKYTGQQHCYRTAASKLLKVDESKISLYLYFLKHDKIVALD